MTSSTTESRGRIVTLTLFGVIGVGASRSRAVQRATDILNLYLERRSPATHPHAIRYSHRDNPMKLSHLAAVILAAFAAFLLPFAPAAAAPQKILVFDFYFNNTSMEPTTPAEKARIEKIGDELRIDLQESKKYNVIPAKEKQLSSVPQAGKCDDDQVSAAKKAGIELVACPWVQKISNLILNLNIVIQNVKTEQFVDGGSVDIRGNTDDSWEHGLRFLLQEHVFQKP
jgi:hypothetical protein